MLAFVHIGNIAKRRTKHKEEKGKMEEKENKQENGKENENSFMVPTRANDPTTAFINELQLELRAVLAAVAWASSFPKGDIRRKLVREGVVRFLNTKQQRAKLLGITNFKEIVAQTLEQNRKL
jgi:hypothetical protein